MRKALLLLSCVASLALAACTGESNRPSATGTADFRAINAMPTSPNFGFSIEERLIANIEYKTASAVSSYDDLDYVFNFEVQLAGDATRTRVASTAVETVRDKTYTFLLTGPIAAPTVTVWEGERRVWTETETVFQARFAHTAASIGPVDVYFQAPGIAPVLGMQAGTIAFTEILLATDYQEGDYVITVTTAGDPADVLFTSSTLTPPLRAGFTMSLFDADANDLGPVAVRLITDTGNVSALADVNLLPTMRFYHASSDLLTSDIYFDDMLTDQVLADHAYRDVTGDIPIAADTYTITYTEAGNIGAILFEDTATVFAGVHNQYYVVGVTDGLQSLLRIPDRRPIETLVRFSFLHTATNHGLVDLHIVQAGTDIAESLPRFINLTVGSSPATASLVEGDFELYLTTAGETTVLAGPIAFSPLLGDIVDYISYNNVDPAIADLVAIPLP